MKRMTAIIVAALAATLAVCALTGCGSQPASSASASASSSASASAASASSAAAQSQDEIIAELKAAIAGTPAFKSVTVAEEDEAAFKVDAEASADSSSASAASSEAASSESAAAEAATEEANTITSKAVYKFDASGDTLKTSVSAQIEDITIEYYTDGDNAVCVTDGPVYSGTVEQFDLTHAAGFEAYLAETIGDLNKLADCAAEAEKMESNGLTFYMLTLDPAKYIATDEALTALAEAGMPVKQALLTVGFAEDGSIVSIDLGIAYEDSMNAKHLVISDYNSTVVDPMPAADKTFEEMEADMQAKLDAWSAELEMNEAAEGGAASSAAAEAK